LWQYRYADELYHHGVKGMKWGVRRTPEQLGHNTKSVDESSKSGIIKKDKDYRIFDPSSDEYYYFSEGTRLQDSEVFAGKGASKRLNEETATGLSEQIGGKPQNWQHCKGKGVIDYRGEDRKAEVHWFQEATEGKHKFKISKWLE
jgi:hypothetical protein